MKINWFYLTFSLTLSLYSLLIFSCKEEKKVVKQAEISFSKEGELSIFKNKTDSLLIQLDIEIADTDYEIQTGLMYRKTMAAKQGMLFIFNDVKPRNFYMKNTQIPLDIIFINENSTIVSFQKNTKPFDETSLPSTIPAKYVLEVKAGKVDHWKINIGDSLTFDSL